MTVSARIMSPKYSVGPNFRAWSASRGPKKVNPRTPSVPAMKEPMAATPRAGPPLPCWASGYPSRQVGTEATSPGILRRMEVVEPPYMAP